MMGWSPQEQIRIYVVLSPPRSLHLQWQSVLQQVMILFIMEVHSELAQEAEQLKEDPAGAAAAAGAAGPALRMSLQITDGIREQQ